MDEIPATEHVKAINLQEGDFMMIMDKPCRIDALIKVEGGESAKGKVTVIGRDLLGGRDIEMIFGEDDIIDEPISKSKDYEVLEVKGKESLVIKDSEGKTFEIQQITEGVPKELTEEIIEKFSNGENPTVSIVKIGEYNIPFRAK